MRQCHKKSHSPRKFRGGKSGRVGKTCKGHIVVTIGGGEVKLDLSDLRRRNWVTRSPPRDR